MKIRKLYHFLVFLVIAISGNPAMAAFEKEYVYIGTLAVFIGLWLIKPLKFHDYDVLIFALFSLLLLIHTYIFGSMVITSSLGFLVRLGIALLAIRLIPEFSRRYVTAMYFLSLISFIFWVPMLLGIDMQSMFSSLRVPLNNSAHFSIGIANLRSEYDGSIRNMGMFWEPGAFAGYLILALFFMIRDGQTKVFQSKQGLVLVAALLSTQSTTGYLAFMVLTVSYAYDASWFKGMKLKILILPLIIITLAGVAYMSITELPFLSEKINQQLNSASVRDDTSKINRFGNYLYDLKWIESRPIVGWSATPETRYSIDREVADLVTGQGNGLTGFAVRFGFVGLAVFIGFFGYATLQLSGSLTTSMVGIFVVCMLLFGEQFLGFPIFLSLMFLPRRKSQSQSSTANARRFGLAISGTGGRL